MIQNAANEDSIIFQLMHGLLMTRSVPLEVPAYKFYVMGLCDRKEILQDYDLGSTKVLSSTLLPFFVQLSLTTKTKAHNAKRRRYK